MARYDVYAGRVPGTLLLDVQTDLIEHLSTRVIVPLLPMSTTPPPIRKLNPVFEINDRKMVMATHLIAAAPVKELGEPVLNLTRHHDQIVAALDMLFQGF